MNLDMQIVLEDIARDLIDSDDAAHDFTHAHRVMQNALKIGAGEGGDTDVLVPAALMHDVVMYPKNDLRSANAPAESAAKAAEVLATIPDFPEAKISRVVEAILQCSFTNESDGLSIDALIIQDADRLEVTGAIAIMRTFWSAGQMKQPLYHPTDPLAETRIPNGLQYGLDLFFTRLLKVPERMNTVTGKQIALERSEFLKGFLDQFKSEHIA